MLPITTADVSTTTGPLTSISPLTAPAITADVAVIFPMITEPTPTLAVPVVTTSPSIFAASAKNSAEEEFPVTLPAITSLPLHVTSPTISP